MLNKVAGAWKATLSLLKIDGAWREIDVGWVKNAGTWARFKWPYVARDLVIVLGNAQGTDSQGNTFTRRSALRTGTGPAAGGTPGAFYQGNMASTSFVINGVTYQIRGIETGSDVVSGQAAWKWVSLQFFGNPPIKNLARVLKFNGLMAFNVDSSYSASQDITFMTFSWPGGSMPANGVNLQVSF